MRRPLGSKTVWWVGWLLLATAACGEPLAAAKPPRGILLLSLDTTRADHLSIYGYDRATSPTLDRLARRGTRFETPISPMPATDPAHLSMLTGLYPRTHGVRKNGVLLADPATPNLATWARDRGYRTAAFISRQHLIPSKLALSGFEHEDGPKGKMRDGSVTVERALAWLGDHGEEPFFLWVHLFDPHFPYDPPEPFDSRFAAAEGLARELHPKRYPAPLTREETEALIGLYDGEIAYMDHQIDRLLAGVDAVTSSGDPPLIVVAGDHGEAMAELYERHGHAFEHGKLLYQGILRVPFLLVWYPVVPRQRVVSGPVELVDIPNTLFDLLGVTGFANQGDSLVPRIRSAAAGAGALQSGETAALAFTERQESQSFPDEMYSVQNAQYKLIINLATGQTELYDLSRDPGETHDLSQLQPAIRGRLSRALSSWLEETPLAGSESQTVPAEKLEALRALGYVD